MRNVAYYTFNSQYNSQSKKLQLFNENKTKQSFPEKEAFRIFRLYGTGNVQKQLTVTVHILDHIPQSANFMTSFLFGLQIA